ncbi:dUTP diphosphatase [Halobacillus halophilus]|uniref:dUTP diphosphatase n=1 Tax=Halobacillus halophilus TaxID=1570 RepID=UPI001CD670C5|nr:dUTP diphosphatase [Halobacillus halophilus]MCA1009888.1 dUTP diphosphatase [Halobacillus halophilus]
MNWETLYLMQEKLDHYIETHHQLNSSENVKEKILALQVELGELANETRCFKFWSTKQASAKETILEEYVDGLHFILSLGLDLGHRYESQPVTPFTSQTEAFLAVYSLIEQFHNHTNDQNYKELFGSYLSLGETLGFSEAELVRAYHAKNEVNYERQDQGY